MNKQEIFKPMANFEKLANEFAYRRDIITVFDDFLQLAICCFAMQRMEKEYLDIISRYKPEEQKLLGDMLGALIIDYLNFATPEGGWGDGLGNFFMCNNSKSSQDYRGQFFTPEHVCDLMAKMTAPYEERELNIADPACGSGRNLIAVDRLDHRNRKKNFYVGSDLDYRCVKMCTLNMYLYGMRGAVIHMDSLSLEIFRGYRIFTPEAGLGIKPLTKEQCLQYVFKEKQEAKEQVKPAIEPLKQIIIKPEKQPVQVQQLSLF